MQSLGFRGSGCRVERAFFFKVGVEAAKTNHRGTIGDFVEIVSCSACFGKRGEKAQLIVQTSRDQGGHRSELLGPGV